MPFASDTALTSAGHNRQAHLKRAHLGLMMLTDRKDIAIWIFEPPYLVTRVSRPNSKLTILNELKSEISFIEGTRLPPLLCLFEKNEMERARAAPSGSNRQNKSPTLASGTRFQAKS